MFSNNDGSRELDTPCFYSMLCASGGSDKRKKSLNNIVCSTGKFLNDEIIPEELRTNDDDAIMSSCTLNRVDDSIETDVTS